jgi:hypothetical protein
LIFFACAQAPLALQIKTITAQTSVFVRFIKRKLQSENRVYCFHLVAFRLGRGTCRVIGAWITSFRPFVS